MLERITPFAISGLLAGVFSLIFGLFVFLKSRDRLLGRVWFLFASSAAGWGFGGFWIGTTFAPNSTLIPFRFAYCFGVVWIAPLLYHFVHVFLQKPTRAVWVQHSIGLAFCLLVPTKYFFSSQLCVIGLYQAPIGGPIYPLFFAWWIGNVIYSHVLLVRAYQNVAANKRMQIGYFFLATAVGFTGGSLCYLPSFGVPLYPWGNFTVFLYPIIMAYAMLRYQLMDVRIFIRRAGLLISVYIALLTVGLPLVAVVHTHAFMPQQAPSTWFVSEIAILSMLLSCGPFLYAYLVRNRSYFKEHTLAGLTHELKSPLATMENALDIFEQRIRSKLDVDDMSYLSMLKSNQKRLNSSVNSLLEVYKVEGQSSMHLSNVNLSDLLIQIVTHWTPLAKLKGLPINFGNAGDPIEIKGDADKLAQALGNLISNAIKFTDLGSIDVIVHKKPEQVEIWVKDTGRGIPPQDLPYIFDRFFQGNVKRSAQGTGIGLTIAKTWIEAHGGKIWAESEGEGKGATVMFTLPI